MAYRRIIDGLVLEYQTDGRCQDVWVKQADIQRIDFKDSQYGKTWEASEYLRLIGFFQRNHSLETICRFMERPAEGVVAKLVSLKLLLYSAANCAYYRSVYVYILPKLFDDTGKYDCDSQIPNSAVFRGVTSQDEAYNQAQQNLYAQLFNSKENEMLDIKVTNKIFINERSAETYSDEEIFELIRKLEDQVKSFEAIQNKPNKLTAQIETTKKQINDLVKYVDNRQ